MDTYCFHGDASGHYLILIPFLERTKQKLARSMIKTSLPRARGRPSISADDVGLQTFRQLLCGERERDGEEEGESGREAQNG